MVCTCAWLHKVQHLCEGEANYSGLDTLALLPSHAIKTVLTLPSICVLVGDIPTIMQFNRNRVRKINVGNPKI